MPLTPEDKRHIAKYSLEEEKMQQFIHNVAAAIRQFDSNNDDSVRNLADLLLGVEQLFPNPNRVTNLQLTAYYQQNPLFLLIKKVTQGLWGQDYEYNLSNEAQTVWQAVNASPFDLASDQAAQILLQGQFEEVQESIQQHILNSPMEPLDPNALRLAPETISQANSDSILDALRTISDELRAIPERRRTPIQQELLERINKLNETQTSQEQQVGNLQAPTTPGNDRGNNDNGRNSNSI